MKVYRHRPEKSILPRHLRAQETAKTESSGGGGVFIILALGAMGLGFLLGGGIGILLALILLVLGIIMLAAW